MVALSLLFRSLVFRRVPIDLPSLSIEAAASGLLGSDAARGGAFHSHTRRRDYIGFCAFTVQVVLLLCHGWVMKLELSVMDDDTYIASLVQQIVVNNGNEDLKIRYVHTQDESTCDVVVSRMECKGAAGVTTIEILIKAWKDGGVSCDVCFTLPLHSNMIQLILSS